MNSSPGLSLEQRAALEILRRRHARTNLLDFTQYTEPNYRANWHHRVLCSYLDRFVSGEIKRLMVFMPPQNGKSELVSRRLPAYIFGKNPNASIITASYSDDLASRMNRDVQRIIDSAEYARLFPETSLSGQNIRATASGAYLRNSDIFEIVGHRGVYRSAGRGSGITGMGYIYGIIDDPLKDRKEANSPTIRAALWDWYTSTFYSRKRKNAGILLTQTRWHEDDLAGRLLKMQSNPKADQWTVVSFPAIREDDRNPDDPRAIGEALWADEFSLEELRKTEVTSGPYEWASLYQQQPSPAEGGVFKLAWFDKTINQPPEIVRAVRYWDLAMSEKTSADYTAGVKLGRGTDGHVYVLDVKRGQIDWGNLTEFMAKTMLADGPTVAQGIEEKGFMTRAIQTLNADPRLHGFSVWGYPVDKDKLTRALPFAAKCAAGLVHPLRAHWTDAWIEELGSFPNGSHDDQVDASSGAWSMLDDDGQLENGQMTHAAQSNFSRSSY